MSNDPASANLSSVAWNGRFTLVVTAALALWTGALFAPPMARASCGDYVRLDSQGQELSDALRKMSPRADSSAAHGPSPVRPPCPGLMCSRQPSPLVPSPMTRSAEKEEWGFPLIVPLTPEVDLNLVHPRAKRCQSVHRPPSVYHPPR